MFIVYPNMATAEKSFVIYGQQKIPSDDRPFSSRSRLHFRVACKQTVQ